MLWELPLAQAFCLASAAMVREGRKIPGPTYADIEILRHIRAARRAAQAAHLD